MTISNTELAGLVRFSKNAIESCIEEHGNLYVKIEGKPYQMKEVCNTLKGGLMRYNKEG